MAARLVWAICRVLLVLFVVVGVQNQTTAQLRSRLIFEYAIDTPTVIVPFEYIQRQIVITGKVDDKKDLTFLFDTGATVPVLDKKLGLKGFHLPVRNLQEADGISQGEAIVTEQIVLGEAGKAAHARNLEAVLTDMTQVSRLIGRKVDGIIGLSFMAGFVVEIDYAKKQILLHSPRTYSTSHLIADNKTTFVFELKDTEPRARHSNQLISGKLIHDFDYDFIFDTGFGGYVSIGYSSAELSGLIKQNTPRITGVSYGLTGRFRTEKIRASYLTLGTINLSGRIVQVDRRNKDGFGEKGLVGNRFLQNYRLIFDHPRRKLWLERVTKTEERDEDDKLTFGITLRTDGGLIHIATVEANSPGARAGLKAGDLIASLNGQKLSDIGTAKAIEMLTEPSIKTTIDLYRYPESRATTSELVTIIVTPAAPLDWRAN